MLRGFPTPRALLIIPPFLALSLRLSPLSRSLAESVSDLSVCLHECTISLLDHKGDPFWLVLHTFFCFSILHQLEVKSTSSRCLCTPLKTDPSVSVAKMSATTTTPHQLQWHSHEWTTVRRTLSGVRDLNHTRNTRTHTSRRHLGRLPLTP